MTPFFISRAHGNLTKKIEIQYYPIFIPLPYKHTLI